MRNLMVWMLTTVALLMVGCDHDGALPGPLYPPDMLRTADMGDAPIMACEQTAAHDLEGNLQTLFMGASGNTFLALGQINNGGVGLVVGANDGAKVADAALFNLSTPFPHSKGAMGVEAIIETPYGYLVSTWEDNVNFSTNWLVAVNAKGVVLNESKTTGKINGSANVGASSPDGTWVGHTSCSLVQKVSHVNIAKVEDDTSLSDSSESLIANDLCGDIFGLSVIGDYVGVLIRHTDIDSFVNLELFVYNTKLKKWINFPIDGPIRLPMNMRDDAYRPIRMFAENGAFTAVWHNVPSGITYMSAYTPDGNKVKGVTLNADTSDILPVPGAYIATFYNALPDSAGARILDLTGVERREIARIIGGVPARLPILAWNKQFQSALMGFIDTKVGQHGRLYFFRCSML